MALLIADTFGNVFLGVAILVIAGAALGFMRLSKNSRKGSVLALGLALYVLAPVVISPNGDRLLTGLLGVVKVSGSVGILIGFFDLFRPRAFE